MDGKNSEVKKKPTTSSKVRNRWNAKHYDRINVTVPKGYQDVFKEYCEAQGTTMNSVLSAIIKLEVAKWKESQEKKVGE